MSHCKPQTGPEAGGEPLALDLSTLPLATIEASLSGLIRGYLRAPSPNLAGRVVSYCEAICGHPDLRDHRTLCGYRKLARHWRWLAEAGSGPAAAASAVPSYRLRPGRARPSPVVTLGP
jgi:hypothetical protein